MGDLATSVTSQRVDPALAAYYRDQGWYGDVTLGQRVAEHAASTRRDAPAYLDGDRVWTWRELDESADRIAGILVECGYAPRDRIGVQVYDGGAVHVALLGIERAGLVAVGVGVRAGDIERRHILATAGVAGFITSPTIRGVPAYSTVAALRHDDVEIRHHLVVPAEPGEEVVVEGEPWGGATPRVDTSRMISPDELSIINSTSGTTGMPKLVMHHQNRWMYFHRKAVEFGGFVPDDVFCALIPAPYGFGLWTSHFTPMLLGAPTIVQPRFDPDAALRAIVAHRATVLCCVTTQFLLMMRSPLFRALDLSSLRVMFTGGENVPATAAAEWESVTGSKVLQFFGSNETGVLSATTLRDDASVRFGTVGRVVPEMNVRLFDDGVDVTSTGVGQPACKGPATCLGYLGDDGANAQLFTTGGWMLMADECALDPAGYITIVGRRSDIIIRGGKNISAVAVENQVSSHPDVAVAAAVAMPDPVFGERVCIYAQLVADDRQLTLEALRTYLLGRGVSTELVPEHLVVMPHLPLSSGGKVAKGDLRKDLAQRLAAENTEATNIEEENQ